MSGIARALDEHGFSRAYREAFKNQTALLNRNAWGRVLEAGAGFGREDPGLEANPRVDEICAVEQDPEAAEYIRSIAGPKTAVRVIDAKQLADELPGARFDTSVCLWNTLFCIDPDNEGMVFAEDLGRLTHDIVFLSFAKKGTLGHRTNYYIRHGIDYEVLPDETIISDVWGKSYALDRKDLQRFSDPLDAEIVQSGDIGGILVYGVWAVR